MKSDMLKALEQISEEKGLSMDILVPIVEEAVTKAYKNNFEPLENIVTEFNRQTGEMSITKVMDVVDEIENVHSQISVEEAKKLKPEYEAGDRVIEHIPLSRLGRIAAQTAKQIMNTKIGEAERNLILEEYADKIDQMVSGVVHRVQRGTVYINLGRGEAILIRQDQNPAEDYSPGKRFNFVINEIRVGKDNRAPDSPYKSKGPQIFVSRTSANLIRRLFEREVPEIESGEVEIMAVSREAGSRTKISVYTENFDLDPVGACVGHKGIRVENIVDELRGEKIDVVEWSENPAILISNALSPARVMRVEIFEEDGSALVVVPNDQLSLAIGKEGQNVRLAARLCGWKIDIKDEEAYKEYLREIGEYEEVYSDEY